MVDDILLGEFELLALLEDLPRARLQLTVHAKLLVALAAIVLARDALDPHHQVKGVPNDLPSRRSIDSWTEHG